MLSLSILTANPLNRNSIVFSFNSYIIENSTSSFEQIYGSICEGYNGGVVLEESLEILFELSDISVEEYIQDNIILKQYGKFYLIPLLQSNKNDQELDFELMRLL